MNSHLVKIVVTVPQTHADIVREEMGKVGAGKLGDYSFCSFSSRGIGRFKPEKGANPAIGTIGNSESVEEERIEVTCEEEKLQDIIGAIKKVHPYEEIALDVYNLKPCRMAGLKQIKSKIRSIEKTRKVTKAMEAVSAAKMRKAQQRAIAGRAYARAAVSVLARVSNSRELASHPLVRVHPERSRRALYIVITSDKGLAGALNSAVLRAVYADILSHGLNVQDVGIIAVGRKANDFFVRRGFTVEAFHPNIGTTISQELIRELVNESADRFALGEYDAVKIAYQHFISTFEQKPKLRTVFPLSLEPLQKMVRDILPKHGKFAEPSQEGRSSRTVDNYTIEPSEKEVLNAILPRLASIFVYHALLESQASEHSARMVAMKSASDKGEELSHDLTLVFNKVRQAAITREVSEITGGMEAMSAS